ncbi:MAG: acyltransferase family protein [Turicibacter sp.]
MDNFQKTPLLSFEQTTVLKGIAILFVMICHLGNQYTRLTTPFGGIGVSIFLILSAYGLSISYEKCGLVSYWRKRIIGVFVPYVVIEILTLPLQGETTVCNFLLDISLLKPAFGLGWYLNYLLLWYIVFWLVNLLKISEKNKLYVFCFITCMLAFYFNYTSSIRFEQSLSFLTGLLIAKIDIGPGGNVSRLINRRNCVTLFTVAIFTLVLKQTSFVRTLSQTSLNMVDLIIKCAAAWAIIEFVYLIWKSDITFKKLMFRLLRPIGAVSYELYLVHGWALLLFNMDILQSICIFLFLIISGIGAICLYYIDKMLCGGLRKKLL